MFKILTSFTQNCSVFSIVVSMLLTTAMLVNCFSDMKTNTMQINKNELSMKLEEIA